MMTAIETFFESTQIAESIGWALFHFVWQGAVIAAAVALLLACVPRRNANARYLLTGLGLVAMALAPLMTIAWLQSQPMETVAGLSPTVDAPSTNETANNERPDGIASGNDRAADAVHSTTTQFAVPSIATEQNHESSLLVSSTDARAPQSSWIFSAQKSLSPALPWFVLAWLAGVIFLSVRMLLAWTRVQRLKTSGAMINEPATIKVFETICARLGLKNLPQLLLSAEVTVPTVIGWLRPAVLMPASVLTGLSTEQLSAIVAHELAHIRRFDYLVNLFQSMIETVLFYHPCVWWLSARVRAERENCCDDLAAEVCGSPRSYAEALLKLEQLKPSAAPALGMGANGARLVDRVARLLGMQAQSNRRNARPFWLAGLSSLTIAMLTLALLMSGESAEALGIEPTTSEEATVRVQEEAGAETEEEQNTITVITLDPEGNPLEGVHVQSGIWSHDRTFPPNSMDNTDATGRVTINLPDEYYILRLWVSGDGYTRMFSNWEEQEIKNGDMPPAEYTFKMIKGVEIGGVVKNDKGEPIAGARIGIGATATHPDQARRPGFGHTYAKASEDGLVTDENGRWSLNTLPPAEDLKIMFSVSHDDYIDDTSGTLATQHGVTTADFLDKSAMVVMTQGVVVSGKLTNSKGEPVDNGLVVWGDRPYWDAGQQEVRVSHDGSWQLPPLPPGKQRITVMCPGYRPETKTVEVQSMMEELEMELVTGRTLKVRFVDAKTDAPISDAYMGINGWRNVESIYNHQHPNVIDSGIPYRTDEHGNYTWNWAPDDEVKWQVGAEGYSDRIGVPLTASDETLVVKLFKQLTIAGNVKDAATGEKIDKFRVTPVRFPDPEYAPERSFEATHQAEPGRNGRFRIAMQIEGSYKLKVEAFGYMSQLTDLYSTGDDVPRLELSLDKSKLLTGTVVDADGNPVTDAQVMKGSKGSAVSLRNYKRSSGISGEKILVNNPDGTFNDSSQDEPCTYAVIHPKLGYAEVHWEPGREIGEVRLTPWTSVEGIVLDEENNPAVGATIAFDNLTITQYVTHDIYAKTDKQGRYRFNKLPAMRGSIRPLVKSDHWISVTHSMPVDLKPGETATANFQNEGVLVKGSIKLIDTSRTNIDYIKAYPTISRVTQPAADIEAAMQANGYDWKKGATEQYRMYATGNYPLATAWLYSRHHYHPRVSSDGSFQIHVLEPGTYELAIEMRIPADDTKDRPKIEKRFLKFEVDEKAIESGKIDLGQIQVKEKK